MLLTYPTGAALLLIALAALLAFSMLSVVTPMIGFEDSGRVPDFEQLR